MGVFFFVCILFSLLSCYWALDRPPSAIEVAFLSNNIVPDSVGTPPTGYVTVEYDENVQAILGNILPPSEVEEEPTVTWIASPFKFYALVCVDLDAYTRWEPSLSEVRQWLVVNIPGDRVSQGDVLSSYHFSKPRPGSGTHRYVFFIFEQIERLVFKDLPNLNVTSEDRYRFSVREFSRRYDLGDPVAGNFFHSRFGDDIC